MLEKFIKSRQEEISSFLVASKKVPATCKNLSFCWTGAVAQIVDPSITLQDIANGYVDGSNDGGIDLIIEDSDSITFYQGKSSTHKLGLSDCSSIFQQMDRTICDLKNGYKAQYNDMLVKKFTSLNLTKMVRLVLLVNSNYSAEQKDKIFKNVEMVSTNEILLVDSADIVTILAKNKAKPVNFKVSHFKSGDTSKIEYEDQGIKKSTFILSGKSIKKTYEQLNDPDAIFAVNLRGYVKGDRKIDERIEDTIKNDKGGYYLKSRGITIICKKAIYNDDGSVELIEASIADGAQNVSILAASPNLNDKTEDIALQCNVLEFSDEVENPEEKKVEITVGINTAKRILPKDLTSNTENVHLLKHLCSNNGRKSVAVEVKRGSEKIYLDKTVTIDKLAQLLVGARLMDAGLAYNGGKTIPFERTDLFNKVFNMNRMNCIGDITYDLVFLKQVLDALIKKEEAATEGKSAYEKWNLAEHCKFQILGIVAGLYQMTNDLPIGADNIETGYLVDFDSVDEAEITASLETLYTAIVKYLYSEYKEALKQRTANNYSNFAKGKDHFKKILDGLEANFKCPKGKYYSTFNKTKKIFYKIDK